MKTRLLLSSACAAFALAVTNLSAESGDKTLVVHEWGTFTSLQDESGAAIGGINTDDEPVPQFVHRISSELLLRPSQLPPMLSKGVPRCHGDITMRLETPVIYFHPASPPSPNDSINVHVKFNGGWLSEFYPAADVSSGDATTNRFLYFGHLRSDTTSMLQWNNLALGGDWSGPETSAAVWTSPRAVQAASVRTSGGEAERFLFYRGVAHLDAPLKISTSGQMLTFYSQLGTNLASNCPLPIRSLWLVDIQSPGKLAFKSLPAMSLNGEPNQLLGTASSHFNPDDYQSRNLEDLKKSLQTALVGEGLFPDEARALLNTWESSYFKSAGLRLFFLVPRAWTDACLPLDISVPSQVQRVMVGRIELVTSAQRKTLQELSQCTGGNMMKEATEMQKEFYRPDTIRDWEKITLGQESLREANMRVPKSYELYLSLGRFRNALLLDEQGRHPSDNLKAFIFAYGLSSYPVATVSSTR